MAKEYIYAVSRIRSKEMSLLTKNDLDTLLHSKNYKDCLRILRDKGFGDDDTDNAQVMLDCERDKLWSLMDELVEDKNAFNVFRYQADFHNLKVAIKSCVSDSSYFELLIHNGTVDAEDIVKYVCEREFEKLPDFLSSCAEEAFKTLLETRSGQLCDVIIDRACLEFVYNAAVNEENEIFSLYAKYLVLSSDVKTAVRCARLNKSVDFIKRAISDCGVIDRDMLINACINGENDIYDYLLTTEYSDGALMLKESVGQFEKWCDNMLMHEIESQKYEHFKIGALIAYIIARQTEIKAVRLILSGKLNNIDNTVIEERLRDMYV